MSFSNIARNGTVSTNGPLTQNRPITGVNDGSTSEYSGIYRTFSGYPSGIMEFDIQVLQHNVWHQVTNHIGYGSYNISVDGYWLNCSAIRIIHTKGELSGLYCQINFNGNFDGNEIRCFGSTSAGWGGNHGGAINMINEIEFYGSPLDLNSHGIKYIKSDNTIGIIKPRINISEVNQSLKIQTTEGLQGFILVDTTEPAASSLRIMTPSGVKAIFLE